MKLLCATLAVFSALCHAAAPWDGTHDDLTVLTFAYNNQLPTGIAPLSTQTIWYTEFILRSSDTSVSGFRVTVKYADETGEHTVENVAGVNSTYGVAIVNFQIRGESVLSLSITALHDSTTHVFTSSR